MITRVTDRQSASYRHQPLPASAADGSKQAPAKPVTFGFSGGALGAFSWGVDLLENRAVELTATDFLGMCVPRSYVEYKKRGWDAARENVIRETTAMMFNVFIAGWLSIASVKLLTNKIGKMNPLGVNHQAWLDAQAMNVYITSIYKNILKRPDIKTPKDAEREFTKEILSHLQSTGAKAGDNSLKHISQQTLNANPALQKTLVDRMPKSGMLSPEAVQTLTRHFTKPFDGVSGKSDLMAKAQTRVNGSQASTQKAERMALSKTLLGANEKRFLSIVDPLAKLSGLTETVNLLDRQGNVLLKNRNRTTVLKQIRYCLHEVLDRAHHNEHGIPLKGTDAQWKEKALHTLYKPREKSLAASYLPKASDGLMDYIFKTKRFTTVLPLVLTIISGISIAFINNHITQKRHGGKAFSPIEEGLRDKMAQQPPKQPGGLSA